HPHDRESLAIPLDGGECGAIRGGADEDMLFHGSNPFVPRYRAAFGQMAGGFGKCFRTMRAHRARVRARAAALSSARAAAKAKEASVAAAAALAAAARAASAAAPAAKAA